MQSSSYSLLSWADGFATKSADVLILMGRILLAWVFVGVAYGAITNFAGSVAYFTSQKLFPPEVWTWAPSCAGRFSSVPQFLQIKRRIRPA
jgi:putative oxidoreductase